MFSNGACFCSRTSALAMHSSPASRTAFFFHTRIASHSLTHFSRPCIFCGVCRVPLSPALSAQAFAILDLLLMAAAFAAVRSRNAGLMCYSFGLHFLAALTVRLLLLGHWFCCACRMG